MIVRHICENIQLISLNILNERLSTDGRILVHALEKALLYKPDIINLSLGTTKWRYKFKLKEIVEKAAKNDTIIVAAAHNEGRVSYPAYLNGVLGVKASHPTDLSIIYYKNNFFYAPSGVDGIKDINEICIGGNIKGTSMSAAYITGYIARMKYSNRLLKASEIINYFR